MQSVVLVWVTFFALLAIDRGQTSSQHQIEQFERLREGKNNVNIETISRITRQSVDTSRTAGIAWNNVVDLIITIARNDVMGQGLDVISLPDVRRNFQRKVGFLIVKGTFVADHGKLSNISSFERSDDVSVVKEDANIWKMVCVYSFKELKVRYDHYKMDAGGFHLQGAIEGTVSSNSVRMTLLFENTPGGCESTLDEVKLVKMEGVEVNVTGLGPFNFLGSGIAKWAVRQKQDDIVETIERILIRETKKALAVFQCDEYASLLML